MNSMKIQQSKSPIYMAGPWITDHEVRVVEDAMRHGWYKDAYGYVERFQSEFAAYHGRAYGIMTPNCTTSIHLLLAGLGIGPGDEVVVPECTWIATAAPVKYVGATPVFCDIDPEHWCLDPKSVRRALTKRTKAILVVDLYGNMPDMDALQSIAGEAGVPLLEDAAESLGSTYRGVRAGKFGIASVFSFHRTKTLTTGEGGMLLLDDKKLYDRCMFLRDHGRVPGVPYYNSEVAFKYMPSNLQAALGHAQFQRIEELVARKREIFAWYRKHLNDVPNLQLNAEPPHVVNGIWNVAVVFGKEYGLTKAQVMKAIEGMGLPSRPFFYPLSFLPAFPGARKKYEPRNPVAYDVSFRGINVPCAFNITEEQVVRYCDAIRTVLDGRATVSTERARVAEHIVGD